MWSDSFPICGVCTFMSEALSAIQALGTRRRGFLWGVLVQNSDCFTIGRGQTAELLSPQGGSEALLCGEEATTSVNSLEHNEYFLEETIYLVSWVLKKKKTKTPRCSRTNSEAKKHLRRCLSSRITKKGKYKQQWLIRSSTRNRLSRPLWDPPADDSCG